MSILTINSAKLGRAARVVETVEEARQVWKDHPEDRGSIYLASEVEAMKGIDLESLEALQMVKDVFHGSRVESATALATTNLQFNAAHWNAAIRETLHQVSGAYPAGCLDWLRANDPGRIAILKTKTKEAEDAYLAKDARALEEALNAYRISHLEAFEEYRQSGEGGRNEANNDK